MPSTERGPDEIDRPVGLVITSVIEAFVTLTWALKAPATIGQFHELYKQIGADLPDLSMLVLRSGSGASWWILALTGMAIAVWVVMRSRITRVQFRQMKLAVRLYTLMLGIVVGTMAYALYAPLFRLGAEI